MDKIQLHGQGVAEKLTKIVRLNESNREAFKKIMANQNTIERILDNLIEIDSVKIKSPSNPDLVYQFKRVAGKMEMEMTEAV